MTRFIRAVIFDCDGVLVDSEMLSAGVLMEMMAEIELPITSEIFRSDFLGRSFAAAALRAEQRFGRPLPADFQTNYRSRLLRRMAADLQPMTGVRALLQRMRAPYCLATSSSPERLAVSLDVTGLAPFFAGMAFTASQVPHGKPAPDLFLFAAERLGVRPQECLVIEDSEMGIRAAQAAGMAAWHFAGGAHIRAGYRLPGGVVPERRVESMDELAARLAEFDLC